MRSKSTALVVVILKDLWSDLNYLSIFDLNNVVCIIALVDILVLLGDSNSLDFECFYLIFSVDVPEEANLEVLVGVKDPLVFSEPVPLAWRLLVTRSPEQIAVAQIILQYHFNLSMCEPPRTEERTDISSSLPIF